MRLRRALMLLLLLGVSLMPATSRGAARPTPDELRLVCDDVGAHAASKTVRPRPDGVHITIVNRTTSTLEVEMAGGGAGRTAVDAEPGVSNVVVALAPGGVFLSCDEYTFFARTRVVDSEHLYIGPDLECGFMDTTLPPADQRPKWAVGHPDPEMEAQDSLSSWMREGDVLLRAGYPAGEGMRFLQVRAGELRAGVDLIEEDGLWHLHSLQRCFDFLSE